MLLIIHNGIWDYLCVLCEGCHMSEPQFMYFFLQSLQFSISTNSQFIIFIIYIFRLIASNEALMSAQKFN